MWEVAVSFVLQVTTEEVVVFTGTSMLEMTGGVVSLVVLKE